MPAGVMSTPEELLADIAAYWDERADSYSASNLAELESEKRRIWRNLLTPYAPPTRTLNVLDVGAGPGFFSILLAQMGHRVTAVDVTQAMLDKARQNAAPHDLDITFVEGNVEDLPFADETFDLVVCRNVTWNLKHPQQAYREWCRLLTARGHLLNFDANWYLHLFDDELGQAFARDRQMTEHLGIPDHYINTDTQAMTAIALQLPLSHIVRPQWDVGALSAAGFARMHVDLRIGEQVWDDEEKVNYRSTPMFMIAAQK